MKSEVDIRDDIYAYIKKTSLATAINGKIYTDKRGRNSQLEDVYIRVSAATFGQVQTAIVEVHIYVPNILRHSDSVRDTARERELARIAADVFAYHHDGLWTIKMESQTVMEVEGIQQHDIICSLYYQHCN